MRRFIQDQAFHAPNVHRNDCCGLGTTTAGILTNGPTAIFETFTPFKCFTVAEPLITILCLKSCVENRRFYAFIHKKRHHHALFHALLSFILNNDLWTGLWHVRCLSVIGHTFTYYCMYRYYCHASIPFYTCKIKSHGNIYTPRIILDIFITSKLTDLV